jgi:predicted NAD/FAD-dependent oxidoreductase
MLRHLPAAEVKPGTVTAIGGVCTAAFGTVLLALPAPQAAPLLAAIGHPFAAEAGRAVMAPCWAVMMAFDTPVEAPDCQRTPAGPLAWMARDSARPGHAALPETWMLHASAAWSRAHLEAPAETVAAELLAAFQALTGSDATPRHISAHRWRHALVETPLGQACLWDPAIRLGLCGDWCLGARVEAAYDSGVALARAALESS